MSRNRGDRPVIACLLYEIRYITFKRINKCSKKFPNVVVADTHTVTTYKANEEALECKKAGNTTGTVLGNTMKMHIIKNRLVFMINFLRCKYLGISGIFHTFNNVNI